MNGLLGVALLALAAVISARLYDHRGRRYAQGKEQRIRSDASFRYVYRYIQVTALAAAVSSCLADHWLLLRVHDQASLQVLGAAVAACGLGLFVVAKRSLGAEYSPCFDSFVPHRLVWSGPYRRVRHPIYTANLTLLGGLAIATGSLWIAFDLALLFGFYDRAARREERALTVRFVEYRAYLHSTGRYLPRLLPAREG